MAAAHTPITTSQFLDQPWNYRLYTTSRIVPMEKPLPEIGSTMIGQIAGALASNLILSATESPTVDGKKRISLQHGAVPADHEEYESLAYTFPPIYPTAGLAKFAGGSQPRPMVVPARVTYEYSLRGDSPLSTWLAANNTGFQVQSNIARDAAVPYEDPPESGNYKRIGSWLNGNFIFQNTVHNGINIFIPDLLAYAIAESIPNATTYVSWITNRTELVASQYITRWKGPIYMRVTKYVPAQ